MPPRWSERASVPDGQLIPKLRMGIMIMAAQPALVKCLWQRVADGCSVGSAARGGVPPNKRWK
jgi:hypothetical protein